jgi:hypothetical protein
MRPIVLAVALLFTVVPLRAETRPVDWIFLVDTSKSMLEKKVFDDVKASIRTFVAEAQDGDSVALLTFDRDARLHAAIELRDQQSRDDLYDIIDRLAATGDRTHLGLAISKGLDRANNQDRTRAIVLFTDGQEDVRGIPNPISIPSNLQRALKSGASMFFVSMGEHEPELRNFARAKFIEATNSEQIRRVAYEIREEIAPSTPPPPPPPEISTTPATLDFGYVDPGSTSREQELNIRSNRQAQVTVSLAPTAGVSMPPQTVTAPAKVKLRIAVADDAPPGSTQLRIDVTGTTPTAAITTINKPSPLLRILKWLVALAIVIGAAMAALTAQKKRNQLEGEIEIVAPRAASGFVGLPGLKATEVALSAIVPMDALAGADARLFVRRKGDDKKVWIAASSGSLRVNDIEVPTTELYDADTIQLGDAKLRFNRIGHERPQEDLA